MIMYKTLRVINVRFFLKKKASVYCYPLEQILDKIVRLAILLFKGLYYSLYHSSHF